MNSGPVGGWVGGILPYGPRQFWGRSAAVRKEVVHGGGFGNSRVVVARVVYRVLPARVWSGMVRSKQIVVAAGIESIFRVEASSTFHPFPILVSCCLECMFWNGKPPSDIL